MCFDKLPTLRPQTSHVDLSFCLTWSLSLLLFFSCRDWTWSCRLGRKLLPYSHWEHWKMVLLGWLSRKCFLLSPGDLKTDSHSGHWNSPTVFWCSERLWFSNINLKFVEKSQTSHLNVFSCWGWGSWSSHSVPSTVNILTVGSWWLRICLATFCFW